MKLDSKYYSFCKEVGLMNENYSRESALNTLKQGIINQRAADPEFVRRVQGLTVSSPEICLRVCMLYQYNATIEYVKNGNIYDTNISDIGTIGIPDHLRITNYQGEGKYRVVKDLSALEYITWNDKNLLTYEDMKKVLTKTIEGKLPSGTTSFRSKDWDVSAYLVPIISIEIKWGDKWYFSNFNLQNGSYQCSYPDNPELLKRGKETKRNTFWLRFAAVALSVIGLFAAIGAGHENAMAYLAPIVIGIINIILWKKSKKNGTYFDRYYIKNPSKTMNSQLIPAYIAAVSGFIAFLFGLIG